jgi:hypothetical protein
MRPCVCPRPLTAFAPAARPNVIGEAGSDQAFQTVCNEINEVIPPVDQEVGGSTPHSCTIYISNT